MDFFERVETIELFINVWVGEIGQLYDYNTHEDEEQKYFKAIRLNIPIPKKQKSRHYYFLHQSMIKEQRYKIHLQRRMENTSRFESQALNINKYKLIGGFVVFIETNKLDSRKKKVYVTMLPAKYINVDTQVGHEYVEQKIPFIVVRTYKEGYKLRLNQTLKMGKCEYKIEQLNNGKTIAQYYQSHQIMNLDDMTLQDTEGNERQCRICKGQTQYENDPLISPCDCKGSAKYIHLGCLKEWIRHKLSKSSSHSEQFDPGHVYHIDKLFCQICKKTLPKKFIVNGKDHLMLNFLKSQTAFIGLKCIQQESNTLTYQQLEQLENQGHYDPQIYITVPEYKHITIGRLDSNNVQIPENSVSRRHAQLRIQDNQFYIRDVGAKFGTLVSAQDEKIKLGHSNSRVAQIGNVLLAFKLKKQN